MHAHILKEEQAAVFNFRTTVGLVRSADRLLPILCLA